VFILECRRTVKCENVSFQNLISKYDIIVLTEAWTNRLSNVDRSGFQSVHSFCKYQHRRAKRSSDDIDIIYIRNEISKAVKVVLNPIDCLIWLTIDKHISILSRKCILVVFI